MSDELGVAGLVEFGAAWPVQLGAARTAGRTGVLRLVTALTWHGLRAFFRSPVSAMFTLGFPLTFLVVITAALGNRVVTDDGVRVAQFLVAPFAVFGVAQAAFAVLAIDTAMLRENGVFKRMRGAPVPAWAVLAGRVGSAVVVSLLAVALLTVVGTEAYGVHPQWNKAPAAVVTLVVGVACFAALGLALVSLTRTVLAVQALANGILIPLLFISDVLVVGVKLPTWLDWLGSALPLKHFARALSGTFDPSTVGSGFAFGNLAAMAGWALAASVVAWRAFGWDPRGGRTPAAPAGTRPPAGLVVAGPGRPSAWSLLRGQIGYALTALGRDRVSVFFAVLFPVLLLALFPTVFGGLGQVEGMPLAQFMLPAMASYGIAVSAYVNLPEGVAQARERGVLKRLRGSPLPVGVYLAGRVASAVLVSAATVVLLIVVGVGLLGVEVDPRRLPAFAIACLLGCFCFAALGFAVLALVPSAQSLTAITVGTLLPLGFVSEVLLIGPDLPDWLEAVGNVFPLRHVMRALLEASRPGVAGAGFAWWHLAVVAVWTVAGLLVARRMRWEPRA